jgi:branched-subunit amino acid aminotransferase/4-amino-4-deoxychorismate lyase
VATPSAPDRTKGLFETLLVFAGEPVELEAHLERLAASLEDLFGTEPAMALDEEMRERARGIGLGRMRVTVDRSGVAVEVKTEPVDRADFFPTWERGAALRSLPCDGGLGPHKWADRRRLGETPAGPVSLILDRGGEVLEAGRANVFVAHGGTLKTPAADGRLLPGIARAGALAAAREAAIPVVEGSITRAELLGGDEVFLTGSVRGVEPAKSLDGEPLPLAGALSRRVAAGLRRRWLGDPSADAAPAPAAVPRPGPLVR